MLRCCLRRLVVRRSKTQVPTALYASAASAKQSQSTSVDQAIRESHIQIVDAHERSTSRTQPSRQEPAEKLSLGADLNPVGSIDYISGRPAVTASGISVVAAQREHWVFGTDGIVYRKNLVAAEAKAEPRRGGHTAADILARGSVDYISGNPAVSTSGVVAARSGTIAGKRWVFGSDGVRYCAGD